jgi:hypothetical protein
MKKNVLLSLLISTFLLLSCNVTPDESLIPLPTKVNGQFVRLTIKSRFMDFSDPANAHFNGVLNNIAGNVSKYVLSIRRTNSQGVITGDYKEFKTITTFPYELDITPSQIADFYGLPLSDIQQGEVYYFSAFSYDKNGVKTTYSDLSRIVQTTQAIEQGYRFNTAYTLPSTIEYNNHL